MQWKRVYYKSTSEKDLLYECTEKGFNNGNALEKGFY